MEKKNSIMRLIAVIAIAFFSTIYVTAQSVRYHVVKEGETLSSIAKKYSVKKSDIVSMNPDAVKEIYPGMELQIPTNGTGNDYGYDNSNEVNNNKTNVNTVNAVNLIYYGFDGFSNYGIGFQGINENGFGFGITIRSSLKDNAPFNEDLDFSYSYPLSLNADCTVFLTMALGPSIRMQNESDEKGSDKLKFYIDGFINPRVSLKYKKLLLSGGFFFWAPQFKFSKEEGGTSGFNVALGFDI